MPHSEKTRQLPSLLLTFAIAIAAAFFLRLFVFELVRVEGPSLRWKMMSFYLWKRFQSTLVIPLGTMWSFAIMTTAIPTM